MGLEYHRLQADLAEQLGDVLGRGTLTGSRVVSIVAGVDPDQVTAQGGNFVFGGHGRARCMLGHLPIVAPAGPAFPADGSGSLPADRPAGCAGGGAA